MSIADEAQAKGILSRIVYYQLICGYKRPFRDHATQNVRNCVDVRDIAALYRFDEGLRHLFLRALLSVARAVRDHPGLRGLRAAGA